MTHFALRPAYLLLLSTTLTSQTPVTPEQPRGGWSSLPLAIGLPNNNGVLLHKVTGDQTVFPSPFIDYADGRPIFTADAMFGAAAMAVNLDAGSIGNDRLPITYSAPTSSLILDPSPGPNNEGWVNIFFSVTKTNHSSTSGVVGMRASNNSGNAGADLFSLYVNGCNTQPIDEGIPAYLVGSVQFEQGFEHMGLPSSSDIAVLDAHIPLVASGENNDSMPFLLFANPSHPSGYTQCTFYFSVTVASASSLNALPPQIPGQLPGWIPGVTISAADVLKIEWQGSSWSAPVVHKSAATLGLLATDNVIGLAVDTLNGGNVIYTVPGNNGTIRGLVGNNNGVIKGPDGLPIRIINAGQVDEIGAYDPEGAEFHHAHGIPVAMPAISPSVGLSVARSQSGDGYVVQCTGWPTSTRTAGAFELWASADAFSWFPVDIIRRTTSEHTVQTRYLLNSPGPWDAWVIASYRPNGSSSTYFSWVVKLHRPN